MRHTNIGNISFASSEFVSAKTLHLQLYTACIPKSNRHVGMFNALTNIGMYYNVMYNVSIVLHLVHVHVCAAIYLRHTGLGQYPHISVLFLLL